jgi:hypothetical protein
VLRIVSMGGGVNSTAILIGMKRRGEKPDAILFADVGREDGTGGEKPETLAHMQRMYAWCAENEFPEIVVIRRGTKLHESLYDECLNNETLPSKAFGFGGCSYKWKREPMDKWVRHWGPAKEAFARGEKVARLLGIHAGEPNRGKIPDTDKFAFQFPLREWGWGQAECEQACLEELGYVPVKSACFFCPSMRKPEVIQLNVTHPELFKQAVEMERNAIEHGELETVRGLGRHWTWEDLVKQDQKQLRLFDDCQAPVCDTCIDW